MLPSCSLILNKHLLRFSVAKIVQAKTQRLLESQKVKQYCIQASTFGFAAGRVPGGPARLSAKVV
jgi:hypothetical protein